MIPTDQQPYVGTIFFKLLVQAERHFVGAFHLYKNTEPDRLLRLQTIAVERSFPK